MYFFFFRFFVAFLNFKNAFFFKLSIKINGMDYNERP